MKIVVRKVNSMEWVLAMGILVAGSSLFLPAEWAEGDAPGRAQQGLRGTAPQARGLTARETQNPEAPARFTGETLKSFLHSDHLKSCLENTISSSPTLPGRKSLQSGEQSPYEKPRCTSAVALPGGVRGGGGRG